MAAQDVHRASGITRRLAAFCSEHSYDDLDDDVVEDVGKVVVDALASAYAGTRAQAGERILDFATDAPSGTGTVIGDDRTLDPSYAALANGTILHALDVDDGHRHASCHPGAAVIPAALAVGEREDVTGKDLVTAIAVGYDAMVKTATAVQTSHRERGFHATATTGCFGAAAAVSSLLDLDETRTAHALGLAGTQAGGLFEFLEKGSMAKRFHPGRAAMAGILAGDLAAVGFDGPDTIIEGEDGFANAFADDYDFDPYDHLGDPWSVTEAYLKPYPCCRHIHGPIDAVFDLRDRGIDPDDVERVRVETYQSAAHHDKQDVETLLDVQMSIPFGVAVAFVEGDAKLAQFDPDLVDDPDIRRLIDATDVVATEEMEDRYPGSRPARVVVELANGETADAFVEYPWGAAEAPLSWDALEEKFHDLAGPTVDAETRQEILDDASALPSLESVRDLTETL